MDDTSTKGPLSLRERDRVRGSKKLLSHARRLRHEATDAEKRLWGFLRARRLAGFKFRRQVVLEPYIVDFVCLEAKLIIEVDGGQHSEQRLYDTERTAKLEAMGYMVLRFWNHDVLQRTNDVLEAIHTALINTPSPQPSPEGRGSNVDGD